MKTPLSNQEKFPKKRDNYAWPLSERNLSFSAELFSILHRSDSSQGSDYIIIFFSLTSRQNTNIKNVNLIKDYSFNVYYKYKIDAKHVDEETQTLKITK